MGLLALYNTLSHVCVLQVHVKVLISTVYPLYTILVPTCFFKGLGYAYNDAHPYLRPYKDMYSICSLTCRAYIHYSLKDKEQAYVSI